MKSSELLSKAQEWRTRAQSLEQRARALQQADNLRAQAASMVAQADQIEGAYGHESGHEGDEVEAAAAAVPAPTDTPEMVQGWPAHLFMNPFEQAQ